MANNKKEDGFLSYLLFVVNGEKFGIDVKQVKDVLSSMPVTSVPQSKSKVHGVLNLRGRIVTVIDTSEILEISAEADERPFEMFIVIEHGGEDYALSVDEVEDVVDYPEKTYASVPRTLSKEWKHLAEGIDPRGDDILMILNIAKCLAFIKEEETVQMRYS